jgi:hypothetical protein
MTGKEFHTSFGIRLRFEVANMLEEIQGYLQNWINCLERMEKYRLL